jgi:prolyl-tRNA synthetase
VGAETISLQRGQAPVRPCPAWRTGCVVFAAVTRLNGYLLPTERQAPADAEALSHRLGVRAGLIRQLGAGLWTWLPAGWRVHQNDAIGGQELLAPLITPAELWKRSGRYDIDELFKLRDRRDAELVLAMTHEESLTYHVASAVQSYRQLPMILYQFQTKARDEPRPRAGVLRTREFVMKDSYSFDRDADGLDVAYRKHIEAYDRIFDRCGLEWYRVESDVGMMGGSGAHEYMAPCPAGENDVALAPGYAANLEVASAEAQAVPSLALEGELQTPGLTTIAAVAGSLGVPEGNLLKAFPVVTESRGLVMVFVRGDHRINEIKLANALGETFRPAREDELGGRGLFPGFLGPGPWVVGANRLDLHRVATVEGPRADIRSVEAGDTVGGHPITIEPAIEIGNIFKLGTRFSEPLGATYLDESGAERPIVMGSYGIGPARVAAAAIEQFSDEKGISWPRAIAPWDVEIVALGKAGTPEREAAEALYAELSDAGLDVLLDDREAGTGEKLTDAELLGVPLRLTVGRRSLESGQAEVQVRRGNVEHDGIPLDGAAEAVRDLWRSLP